jgi:hypothetical protein
MSLDAYIAAIRAAIELRLKQPPNRIGRGVKNTCVHRGPRRYVQQWGGVELYGGAHLRAICAEKGVGRPPHAP